MGDKKEWVWGSKFDGMIWRGEASKFPKNKKRPFQKRHMCICGIDSDCNTKAVSLNRFYAVDNKAISEMKVCGNKCQKNKKIS